MAAEKYDLPQAPLVFEIDTDAVLGRENLLSVHSIQISNLHAEFGICNA